MLALDICGNDNNILLQKSFIPHRINDIAHLVLFGMELNHRKGAFRATVGSDEYAFNDPQIGIPGILLSRHPYREYHNADDTPEKIHYDKIEEMGKVIEKIIEYWDADFIPKREFKAPLRRSKYGIQSSNPQFNLSWDYLFYSLDGKKYLSELCSMFGLNFEQVLKVLNEMEKNGDISGSNNSKGGIKTPYK